MKNTILKMILTTALLLIAAVLAVTLLYGKRTNILLIGLESTRTDTMIVVSLDPKNNEADLISVPRDTYHPVEGKDGLGQKKLNAVYGFKDGGGNEGVRQAVEEILGIDIPYVIAVDYDAVKAVVDLVDGVEVDVPFAMNYDDPYADPPLHIHLDAGVQTLTGDDAIGFIRFRKSNDGRISDGDVGRIERQKKFLTAAAEKTLTWRLPFVVSKALPYVDANLPLSKAVLLSTSVIGMSQEDIYFHTLPEESMGRGSDGLYYFFHDPEDTEVLMEAIVSGNRPQTEEKE